VIRAALAAGGIGLAGFIGLLAVGRSATAQQVTEPIRYSHSQHADLGVQHQNCGMCHRVDTSANVLPPLTGKDHKPCSEANCHASQFFAREAKICAVCHDAVEPWQKQPAVVRRRRDSEYRRDVSHQTHAQDGNGSCKQCHGDPYTGQAPPRGHATCAPCHGTTAKPTMAGCSACHGEVGKAAKSAAASSEWSVAGSFSHRNHGRDPRTSQETDCAQCHQNVRKSARLETMANPPMRSCDGCHNGMIAFKTTGFGCYRCHSNPSGP
jgi:c(7)-type cytochrome triheme protein